MHALVLLLVVCWSGALAGITGRLEGKKTIWKGGEGPNGGYWMFNAPQLVVTTNGTLLSVVEGRKTPDGDDSGWHDILMKRSFDSGDTWSDAAVAYSESGPAHGNKQVVIGNSALVVDITSGTIFMGMCRNNSEVLMISSQDHGASWSPMVDITASVKPKVTLLFFVFSLFAAHTC